MEAMLYWELEHLKSVGVYASRTGTLDQWEEEFFRVGAGNAGGEHRWNGLQSQSQVSVK